MTHGLNKSGAAHAKGLIESGAVDKASAWSISADDENRMLGDPKDWKAFGAMHLGVSPGVPETVKNAWAYPFGKGGKVYRSALIAIRQRAAQQKDTAIFEEAGKLIAAIDGMKAAESGETLFDGHGPGSTRFLGAVGDPADDSYGYTWRVQVNEYGLGKDGRINWTREPLVAAIPLMEGARVFALNESQHQSGKTFGKSVKEIVGWLSNVTDTGTAIEANFNILTSAKWLRDGLIDSFDRGKPDLYGLSLDALGTSKTVMVAGRQARQPVTIKSVEVDVVYDPTNAGKFIQMAAASAGGEREREMLVKLLVAMKKTRPDLVKEIEEAMTAGTITEDQALEKLVAAMAEAPGPGDGAVDGKLVAAVAAELKKVLTIGPDPAVKTLQASLSRMILDQTLTASKLPEKFQASLRRRFADIEYKPEELQAAIQETKELVDSLNGSGAVAGAGQARVGREGNEKFQAAVDKLFGVPVGDTFKDVPQFRSLKAAYIEMTGDSEVRGYLDPGQIQRMQAAFGSTTFSYVLGNSLYRQMIADYREMSDYGVSLLVGPNIRNAQDFRTMESVKIAYFGDLPDITPETVDYPDLGVLSDEEISYAINQKGGIITITRQMILNDDMRAVDRIRSRIPRAARRTLAKRCWAKLINNDNYKGDGKAMFHVDHGNLGSTAYAHDPAVAAKIAFEKQAEPGSGERIGLTPKTLSIPTDLWGTATELNQSRGLPGSPNFGNAMFQYFGANNEGIFVNPFMTDVTDWIMLGDPALCPILELAFLHGRQEPEMFVADNPAVGQMFVADKIQYKVRHEYECEIDDYRNARMEVVAG